MVALGMGTRSKRFWYWSMVSLRVGMMQLHKLHKYASELEQSGGGRGRAEVEGVGGSQRWAEKGKGGCTMTLCPTEYCFSANKYSIWYSDCSNLMEWKVLPPWVRDFRRIANWYGSMAWWVIHVTWFTVLHDNLNMMQPEAWTCAHLVHVWAMDWNLEQACPSHSFINQWVLFSTFKSCLSLTPFFSFLILKDLIPPPFMINYIHALLPESHWI